jgi:acetoacetyl-CoA synthetase
VSGIPTLPVYRGEMQGPALGVGLAAYDDDGRPVVDEVGELVVTEPMPSMPVAFWNDPDGARLREAYFDHFPGVWRHGDWVEVTDRQTVMISGRSDSTINRGGVRIGTGEIYRAVLADEAVVDALVVDGPRKGAENWMALFVALRDGDSLSPEVAARIRQRIRRDCSPRHVPDDVLRIPRILRTLSGKLVEIPVKRILMGVPPDRAVSRESLADPSALDSFIGMVPPG